MKQVFRFFVIIFLYFGPIHAQEGFCANTLIATPAGYQHIEENSILIEFLKKHAQHQLIFQTTTIVQPLTDVQESIKNQKKLLIRQKKIKKFSYNRFKIFFITIRQYQMLRIK